MHFNKLTPAEDERLALLLEEMGEALQIIGKIQRHGYDSKNPLTEDLTTNRQLLEMELGHAHHAMTRLCDAGDLHKDVIIDYADGKAVSVVKWLHHQ